MNHTLLLAFIVLVIGTLARVLLKKDRRPKDNARWPLAVRTTVLSPPEQILYRRLTKSLPQHLVFPQVQLSRFLDVEKGVPRQGWFNRISQLSADFLILRLDTSVVAAIELDDASHETPSRRDADARKTQALHSAGVKLIRWQVKFMPDEATIQTAMAELGSDVPGVKF